MTKKTNKILIWIMIISLFLSWIEHIIERTLSFMQLDTPSWLVVYVTLLLFTYTIIHSVYQLGAKNMIVFVIITMIISFIFEAIKTTSGLLVYGDLMGPKILGIPNMMPFWFFILIYAGYSTTNLIFSVQLKSCSFLRIIFLSFTDGIVVTSWLTMEDSINVTLNSWRWTESGDYFGSPIIIFIYWVLTIFFASLFFRLYARKITIRNGLVNENIVARYTPFFSYSWLAISAMVGATALGHPGATLAGFFASAPFILIGFHQIFKK